MHEYHKIDTIFKRDPSTNFKRLMIGDYSNDAFAYLANNIWVFTEKVDGTNIRVMISPEGSLSFGGKTDSADMPAALVGALEAQFLPIASDLHVAFPEGACLYGEGYGGKIQAVGKYRPDSAFVMFDIKVGDWWLQRQAIEDVAVKFAIDVVPIVGEGSLHDMIAIVKAGTLMSRWGDFQAEGLVAKPKTELCDRSGRRIVTKLKVRDF